jgi:hypothetical protein
VFANVTLFLSERDMTVGYAPGIMYALSKQHSLCLVKLFTSVYWRFRLISVLGCIRLETLEEREKAHLNAFVRQDRLRVVYHKYQSRLFIFVVTDRRLKTLVNILIL